MRQKQVRGIQTGDMVRGVVEAGKKVGTGKAVWPFRKIGRFNIQTLSGEVQGIPQDHCTLTKRAVGYGYHVQPQT